jgi:hypothetical protein
MRTFFLALLGSIIWHLIFLFWVPVGVPFLPELRTKSPEMTFVGKVIERRKIAREYPQSGFTITIWEKLFQPLKPGLKSPKIEKLPWGMVFISAQAVPEVRNVNVKGGKSGNSVLLSQALHGLPSSEVFLSPPYIHPVKVEMKKLVADLKTDFTNWLKVKKLNIYVPESTRLTF